MIPKLIINLFSGPHIGPISSSDQDLPTDIDVVMSALLKVLKKTGLNSKNAVLCLKMRRSAETHLCIDGLCFDGTPCLRH